MDNQQKHCVIAAIVIMLIFACAFIFMDSDYYKDNYPSVVHKQSNTQSEQDCTVIIKMLQNESYTIVWEGSIEEYYSYINSAEASPSVMNSSDDIQITINCNGVI